MNQEVAIYWKMIIQVRELIVDEYFENILCSL